MKTPIADDYELGEGEINNVVYLVLKYTVGWGMRACDLAVCKLMAEGPDQKIRGNEGLEKLVRETCEYAWDHIAGEPDEPTTEQLYEHIAPVITEWYEKTPAEQRQITD